MSARIVVFGAMGHALVGAALAARARAVFTDGDAIRPAVVPGISMREMRLRGVISALGAPDAVVGIERVSRPERDWLRSAVPSIVFVQLVPMPGEQPAPRRRRRRQRIEPDESPIDALLSDERGVRIADDAGLDQIVARIVAALESQSLR